MDIVSRSIRAGAFAVISLILAAGATSVALSQTKNAEKLADATREAQKAADVFTEIMNVPDKAIPQNLLDSGRQACQDAGMDGFLTKPVDPAELDKMFAEFFPDETAARTRAA